MKSNRGFLLALSAAVVSLAGILPGNAAGPLPLTNKPDESFRNELQRAIDRGLDWLRANQHSNGWWSTEDTPAVTALALAAFISDPSARFNVTNPPAPVSRGLAYITASAQPDGSIQRGRLPNYNTAICMTTLAMTGDRAYDEILLRGRAFLTGLQIDLGERGGLDSPFDGGVGYSGTTGHSDLNNTLSALEAMRSTEHLVRDRGPDRGPDLNWNAAIQFIQNCQNLPSHNRQSWVSTDQKDLGGFIYHPGRSNAGSVTNADGRVALRSYGSISYAGLLSYIYADLEVDDPRVAAVKDWLRNNYTLAENPGMGEEGLYYYLHLMAKALNAAGVDRFELTTGERVDWRRDLAMRLINLQQRDGSWVNQNNRWWEKDPCLVTAYSLLALEILWRGM